MNEREVRKYLRREFRPVGWSLTIYYGIMNLMVMAVLFADVAIRSILTGRSAAMDMSNAWGYMAAIAVGMVILLSWKGADFWNYAIWMRGKPCSPGKIGALIVLVLGLQLPNSLLVQLIDWIAGFFGGDVLGYYEQLNLVGSDSLSMFLYAGLFAPVAEEILFRGLVLRSLQPYGRRFAIVMSALLFGLFHGNLVQMPYAFCVGLILGYTACEYSIGWSMVLHMVNNLLFADSLTRLTEQLPGMLGSVLQSWLCLALTAGAVTILAVKHREIQAYFRREYWDKRCAVCFLTNSGSIVFFLIMLANTIVSMGIQ